jgi:hypothetical protein
MAEPLKHDMFELFRTTSDQRLMTTWTRTPPPASGYYWAREPDDPATEHIVEIGQSHGVIFVMRMGTDAVASDEELASGKYEFWPQPIASPSSIQQEG